MTDLQTGNLGYPRIGKKREWKKALEAFWSGTLTENDFAARMEHIRLNHLRLQKEKGIDQIPVHDFTFYDHMLDMAAMFGIVPKRFSYDGGPVPLSVYFAMARGNERAAACEMTKWFNTNYHYIVPELRDARPVLTENRPLKAYKEAKEKLGIEGKPVVVGPYTFLKLSKGYEPEEMPQWVERLVPLYVRMLQELEQEGVQWVQMDEPILVTTLSRDDLNIMREIYTEFHRKVPRLHLMLQTYFESVDHYGELMDWPVKGIGLDFVHDNGRNLRSLENYGFPEDKMLGVGLIDGRNVWRSNLEDKLALLERVAKRVPNRRLVLQPSCSLLHVPVTTEEENRLDPVLKGALAFANEKLDELAVLAQAVKHGRSFVSSQWLENQKVLMRMAESASRSDGERPGSDTVPSDRRNSPFPVRRKMQQEKWKLPLLPTTTIGSFPQTPEIRKARQQWRSGQWTQDEYETFIRRKIEDCIRLQEEIGLDVLVHGEFERTDMVEFFGEKLDGFAFTQNGWVQSYGSRCVKPPIIYGNVRFVKPMTVAESAYAQSLTDKPVKGMLTGPITLLNWSFVRDDLSREQVAYQIALALRQEVEALEKAGIHMIQVDEPALREGLPLKTKDQQHYLNWAVRAFRLATSSVQDTTQIHTHMCYCEFHDMIDSIRDMDADVISIESSRSHGELIRAFEQHGYDKGIGLGVYDIHSPRIPPVEEMVQTIERSLSVLDPALFWINPDCGLKTRGMEETLASLKNMVRAAHLVREKIALSPHPEP